MIIVGGIIKNSDNKYLLIKERKEKYYGMYNIPAGHLEENELIDGAKREIKEETGYTVDVKGIVQVGDTEKFTSFIFYCEIISEQESYNSDEILSVEWLSLDEINNIADQLRSPELILDAIKRVEDKKVYSLDIIK